MGGSEIVSMNDEEFRIGRITQAFGDGLILCARTEANTRNKTAAATIRYCMGSSIEEFWEIESNTTAKRF